VKLNYGKPLPDSGRSENGPVPVFGANGVKAFSERSLHQGPSVIIGRKGSAGEINRANGPFWPLDVTYFTTHDDSRLDFDFLEYALRQMDLPSLAKGVKPGINRNEVYALPLPLPPLGEQKRIVAVLDQAFAALDRARALAEANLGDTAALIESTLEQLVIGAGTLPIGSEDNASTLLLAAEQVRRAHEKNFRSPRICSRQEFPKIPEGWIWASAEQLCLNIVDCLHSTPKWTNVGKLCLRTTNFRPNRLDLSEVRFVSDETFDERTRRLTPEPGDVLYSREGGILGIACVIPDGVYPCLGQRMMQFRVRQDLILPDYFCAVLNSRLILQEVRFHTGGAAAPHLNIGDIRRFPIPVPPMSHQIDLMEQLRSAQVMLTQIADRFSQKISDIDTLSQSVMKKAFAGEFT
jgi:type I restriction enzyme S subunit